MIHFNSRFYVSILIALSFGLAVATLATAADSPIEIETDGRTALWHIAVENDGALLTVTGSGSASLCNVVTRRFERGETPKFSIFDEQGELRPDGAYSWQVSALPVVDPELRERMKAARLAGEDLPLACKLEDEGRFKPVVRADAFQIREGKIYLPTSEPERAASGNAPGPEPSTPIEIAESRGPVSSTRDFVINDDLIVDGSACIGFDCVNGESFGFDTIRLKENNLRIKFLDTSVGTFPTTDWQLTANTSQNGGLSKFSIDDISAGATPFTVEASAPSHSLYVDDGGRLGAGTSVPSVDIHIKDGDTPTLRLQQDGSAGFQPQTWDVAGNESSFFIRDATNGSTLPLRIRPSAPSHSLVIDPDGDIGIGTLSPDASMHLLRSNGTAQLHIEDTGSTDPLEMLVLENDGKPRLVIDNSGDAGGRWFFGLNNSSEFVVSLTGSPGNELRIDQSGNLFTLGSVNPPSDVRLKREIDAVDPRRVLATLAALPISTWSYHWETPAVRHIGPMAQDFHRAFGFGPEETSISTVDSDGVALAAIQGLHQVVQEKEQRIDELAAANAELEARLAALEALVLAGQEAGGR